MAFPCKEFVLSLSQSNLCEIIRQSTSKRISEKRIAYLTDKLIKLAKQSFCAVKKTSPMLEEVRYYAQELLCLSELSQGTSPGWTAMLIIYIRQSLMGFS